ncbi:transcriptional regulator, AraC family [Cyclobacterium lianum]|uniref:Transcriptional regulator, AraC family n=1 Tax=Cyclobacterium lianum TaxID=388280 RepID=A0A1M7IWL9_9BACT|nr:helix-turn-helix domain-containing protein [Cyclobacterium lianum]SHM45065.1 transcriptional regulator, AraC family [Cyclobacterium lianum]
MSDPSISGEAFIDTIEAIVLDNVSQEDFGVSELAEAMNMSRSNLLRKIKKYTHLSASQYIRQIRLKKGMELLKQTSLTVSEISFQVGFGSTSYFIKCFREHYGYAPGEARKSRKEPPAPFLPGKKYRLTALAGLVILLFAVSFFIFRSLLPDRSTEQEKSIAVLPFKNESSDSANLYFINGLMESALSKLQKIQDLRVVSRTSVEQFRNTDLSIPEIAEILRVSYILEGSGQRVGEQVLLNMQLVEAATDQPVWSGQYTREIGDIFALQNEIAGEITDAIKVVVTPAELERIEKQPTDNLIAYDYYLQALERMNEQNREGLLTAIPLLEKAVEEDPQFALSYANLAISYYYLDIYQIEKQFTDLINNYADKALLYDSKSAESLIAKALYYLHTKEYRLALPHLEKALEYNPNSLPVIQLLADFYARITPNTARYLEYALKGIQLDVGTQDSVNKSYTYLHLSNALIQNGFVDESIRYINQSIAFNPDNEYAPFLNAYILYAKNRDIKQTTTLLLEEWQKDSSRLDILQEVAKMHYFQEDYTKAFVYYEQFVTEREKQGLGIYPQEDIKIGLVYEKMGYPERAAEFYNAYARYCEQDQSIYKSASMAVLYAQEGKIKQAFEQLRIFSQQENYQYWIVLFFELDPLIAPLKEHPEFKSLMQRIKDRFWEKHGALKKSLEAKGLI